MNRWLLIPIAAALSFILIAAGGLPDGYWESPHAISERVPHEWSELERNLNPQACGQCHVEQYEAWRKSLHASAYSPGMIGQFPSMGHNDANDCLNCHAPLAEQKYGSDSAMAASLLRALKKPEADDIPQEIGSLRHAGVTCAACHVRGWQRFGPPRLGSNQQGKIDAPVHNGFTAIKAFEKSQFCASCHQFPQSYAINGKPLENTVAEWQQSRFAREGVQCQNCHMPDRKHEFRGIHDKEMVRKGLDIVSSLQAGAAILTLTSSWIGHAFPTYVTPKVLLRISAENSKGEVVKQQEWELSRIVRYKGGWKEVSDTRLMPDETRLFTLSFADQNISTVRFTIDVIPDHFYEGVYRELLEGGLGGNAKQLIATASSNANQNDYRLYEHTEKLK